MLRIKLQDLRDGNLKSLKSVISSPRGSLPQKSCRPSFEYPHHCEPGRRKLPQIVMAASIYSPTIAAGKIGQKVPCLEHRPFTQCSHQQALWLVSLNQPVGGSSPPRLTLPPLFGNKIANIIFVGQPLAYHLRVHMLLHSQEATNA